MRVALAVTEGPHAGREFIFDAHDNFIVGRSKEAHFQLPQKDPHFSRIHFMVEVNPPNCRLLDMQSTNGTFVNGKRVRCIDLRDGDRIQGGKTTICFWISEPTPVCTQTFGEGNGSADSSDWPSVQTLQSMPTIPRRNPRAPTATQAEPARCVVCQREAAGPTKGAQLCDRCLAKSRDIPQTLPQYLLIRELGRGAMGVVHLAVHRESDAVVAVKTVVPEYSGSQQDIQRFLREAEIVKALRHPNVVGFLDLGALDDQLYFAMEYVQGVDAARLVKKHGPLSVADAAAATVRLLDGLEFAHQAGFVHRDVKPANLLISARTGEVKIADFGLARTYQNSCISGLTLTGEFGGTIAFMAPEQLTQYREAKPPVDQYSAGATLYYLLTGTFVYDFPKRVENQILMLLQKDPIPIQTRRPDLSDQLSRVVHRALQREPRKRFQSAAEMRARLEPFLASKPEGTVVAEKSIS